MSTKTTIFCSPGIHVYRDSPASGSVEIEFEDFAMYGFGCHSSRSSKSVIVQLPEVVAMEFFRTIGRTYATVKKVTKKKG